MRFHASVKCASLLLLVALLSFALATADDVTPGLDEDADAAAAAAAVEEAAEDEEDDETGALDEDADAARYDPDRRHPLSELPPAATDVHIAHAFPSGMSLHADEESQTVTLGEPVKTVVAFSNQGRSPYHVWGVMGSLNNHVYFPTHVQNFSYALVNKSVPVGEELSLSYEFTPNARLDIVPFQLAVTIFYEAQSSKGNAIRGHSTTFFNQTILTRPGSETMSNNMFMLFFFVGVAAAVAAWYVWKNLETAAAKQEGVETSSTPSSRNEWLEDHIQMNRTGGGRAKLKPASKK